MRLVIVESPFAPQTPAAETPCTGVRPWECAYCIAEVKRRPESAHNIAYARAALRDCLLRGESPYASHLLYTQAGVLDDTIEADRNLGIDAGFAWRGVAELTVVYADLGISKGMQAGIDNALRHGRAVEYRSIVGWQK